MKVKKLKWAATFLASISITLLISGCADNGGNADNMLALEGGKWAEYYENADLDGLMTLYTDDVVVALHGQPALYGKAAVREYFSSRIDKAISKFELDYEVREIHGDVAYLISKYWLRAEDKETGEVFLDAGRSLLIYKRDSSGHFKIAADIDQASPDVTWPSPLGME
ncbi:MAG: ketosteroid isomerase-like protein [Porticoccaceae bacterium]|jgi:ketosteroid isomerase-like protein